MIASGSAAVAKKGVTGIMSVFAAIGITSESIPLFLAVIIGLFGGTAAAWARERKGASGCALKSTWGTSPSSKAANRHERA